MDMIETLRSQLDALDAQLVDLVASRFEICLQIAQYKQANGIPMMQPGRIEKVKRQAAALGAQRGLSEEFIDRFYDLIIEEACQIELARMHQVRAQAANVLERDCGHVTFEARDLSPTVVIGANGAVGRLFASKFRTEGIYVIGIDRAVPASGDSVTDACLAGDVLSPDHQTVQAIAGAKTVVVCLPERTALAAFPILRKYMAPHALWVDTLSVKSAICKLLADNASGLEIVSLNPMFAPCCGFAGQNVAAVEVAPGLRSANLMAMLRSWNANVTILSAEDHDLVTAGVQVAVHAAVISFGLALRSLGINYNRALNMATPPFLMLTALLARVLSANPGVYWDIQAGNPHGARTRLELQAGLAMLQDVVAQNDFQGFCSLLSSIREDVGQNARSLESLCAHLFDRAQAPANHSAASPL